MPPSVSTSTVRSMVTRARSGRTRPAMILTIDVLPDPERPNRAIRPPSASNCAWSWKAPSRCLMSTARVMQASFDVEPAVGEARHHFRGEQRKHGDGDGDEGEAEGARVAAWHLGEGVDRRRQR